MPIRLLSSLVLVVWAQQAENPRPLSTSALGIHVPAKLIDAGTRETRTIMLERYAPAEGDDEPPRLHLAVQHLDRIKRDLKTTVAARENFDAWLFGEPEPTAKDARRHLEEILLSRVRDAVRERGLTAMQRAKLELAGRGDIKRFFDQVEDRRRSFESSRRDLKSALGVLIGLRPLSQLYRHGPFGDGSLVAKTLRKIEDEQKAGR